MWVQLRYKLLFRRGEGPPFKKVSESNTEMPYRWYKNNYPAIKHPVSKLQGSQCLGFCILWWQISSPASRQTCKKKLSQKRQGLSNWITYQNWTKLRCIIGKQSEPSEGRWMENVLLPRMLVCGIYIYQYIYMLQANCEISHFVKYLKWIAISQNGWLLGLGISWNAKVCGSWKGTQ